MRATGRGAASPRRRRVLSAVLAAGCGLLGSSLKSGRPDFTRPIPYAETATVLPLTRPVLSAPAVRGPLQRTVRVSGELNAVDKATVYSQCLWDTYVVDLLPEGTFVREGDVVARLEETELREREDRYRVRAFEGRADVEEAKQRLATQELTNERRLAKARLTLKLAEMDLESYRDGLLPAEMSELGGSLELAREEVVRAGEQFEYVRRMARKGYQSATDVEAARLKLHRSEHKFAVASDALALLSDYTGDRELKKLEADARIAGDELARAEAECAILLQSRQFQLASAEKRAAHYDERLQMVVDSLAACTVRAPRDGRVVWARTAHSRGFSTLEPGEEVDYKEAVFEIPRFDEMLVNVKVAEADSRKVAPGQRALIRLDARPGVVFEGTVLSIDRVPTADSYPNYDRRVYRTEVAIDADPAEMDGLRPGLTAAVEILAGDREDCLQVPVQSVVKVEDRPVVFVRTPGGVEVRDVELGLKATSYAEIAGGLSEGEEVVLSPRTDLTEQLIELWSGA